MAGVGAGLEGGVGHGGADLRRALTVQLTALLHLHTAQGEGRVEGNVEGGECNVV